MYFKVRPSPIAHLTLLLALTCGVLGAFLPVHVKAAPQSLSPESAASTEPLPCDTTGWVWMPGPRQPEIARQAEAALSERGIESFVTATAFGEQDACGNFHVFSVDLSLTLNRRAGAAMAASNDSEILAILDQAISARVGNVRIESGSGSATLYAGEPGTPDRQQARSQHSVAEEISRKNVYVIAYDPILANGQSLSAANGWNSYTDIATEIVDYFRDLTGNQLRYDITRTTLITDRWPTLIDGYVYTELAYFDVLAGRTALHSPTWLDYDKLIEDLDICQIVNEEGIDEVWLFGGPWFGYYESRLVGPGAYAYNSPAISLTHGCDTLVPIMGLNYERGLQEAIHSFGHRTEAALTKAYGSWQQNRTVHSWDRFGLVKHLSPSYAYSGCGSIHYPPNGTTGYDYGNPAAVLTNCEDFLSYPALNTPETVLQSVTCTRWDCDHLAYLSYWYTHLPAAPACGTDAVENNWWTYFADPSLALFPSLHCPVVVPATLVPGAGLRVSVNSAGGQAHGESTWSAVSADGRYVAFSSAATNLVFGDLNKADDIFLRDLQTGILTRVSVNSDGSQGNGHSGDPSISADGRFIAFQSSASDLVSNDSNAASDIFVHDTQTGQTVRVSLASGGGQSNGGSYAPSISADGRYIAFASDASNLVAGDTNRKADIFVHDRQSSMTFLVSVGVNGAKANQYSNGAAISADGSFVAFHSYASNLVEGDTNSKADVFVRDMQAGVTTRVSVSSGAVQANNASTNPSISADGRSIAFESIATNLVADDTSSLMDVFVHDRQTGLTTRVSVSGSGQQASHASVSPSISADGRYVAFYSRANNLAPGDTNSVEDVFVHDRHTGAVQRVSIGSGGAQANNASNSPVLSGDGQSIVFKSYATNLAANDTNGQGDVFLHRQGMFSPPTITPTPSLTPTLTPNVPPTVTATVTPIPATTPIFADVPVGHWARQSIEKLYANGITGGCSTGNYCPDGLVTRTQMAVFLGRSIHGASYTPPPVGVSTGFKDVDPSYWAAAWIRQLAADGVTSGCGSGNYCPEGVVTRAQMAVFLLRAKYGANYQPPSMGASSGFGDVPLQHWAAPWIKQLAAEGITSGCSGGNFCPEGTVTRAQMAVFLVKTFNFP